ncbi:MAG: response regulator [candidate division KSB1 bacterium]|nr:response regulator [candidate division KSB1 bacterium]MDQ7063975.1 response regulator [candidate division KSB1 bacterium]
MRLAVQQRGLATNKVEGDHLPNLEVFRILIIENDSVFRRSLFKALTGEGYTVFAAADLVEATEFISQVTFSLILYGLRRPYQGGLDQLKHLLQIAKNTQIIVVTTFNEPELKRQVLDMGARDLIVKPVRKAALLNSVANVLQVHS